MNDPNNMVVTNIHAPIIVHSQKGRVFQMKNRQTCGLSLCISGQITYKMNDKTYISTPNTAVLLPKGGSYSLLGNKEGMFPLINFTCTNFSCDEIMVIPLEQAQSCIKSFETIKSLFQRGGSFLEIYSAFYDLLGKVFSVTTPKPMPLDFAIKYIEQKLQDPELSNVTLADKIGISEVYLRKLFLSYCGVTPRQYILEARIVKGKQMLVDTPLTVTTIARECGFSSVYHFCRAFKKRTGITPTQYAAQNRIYKM